MTNIPLGDAIKDGRGEGDGCGKDRVDKAGRSGDSGARSDSGSGGGLVSERAYAETAGFSSAAAGEDGSASPSGSPRSNAEPLPFEALADEGSPNDFASLSAAVSQAGADPTVITVDVEIPMEGTIDVAAGQHITLSGSGALCRGASYVGLFFRVAEGATLSIDGVSMDGRGVSGRGLIGSRGTVELHAGRLTGINCEGAVSDSERSAVFVSGQHARFFMDGGEICDNEYSRATANQFVGAVMAEEGASVEIVGGTVARNELAVPGSAAVVVFGGEERGVNSSFHLGGTAQIVDNVAYHGAVMLGDSRPPLLFDHLGLAVGVMDGGTIARNTAQALEAYTLNYGGGVMVYYHASFTLNDGVISDNVGKMGAGVCVTDGYVESGAYGADLTYEEYQSYDIPGEFVMNGGQILRNNAAGSGPRDEGCGGGVYAASNNVVIRAGTIADNTAGRQGGGVYLGCVPYTMRLYDALITENTAEILGGGLWFCPTGDATNAVTNGGAIFGNTSLGAGDDFAAIPQEGKTHAVTLADRMLGGGEAAWYKDGGVNASGADDVLGLPDGSPRFDPLDPGERLTNIENSTLGYALKSVTTPSAEDSARAHAKLFITGNSAPRGGGIGANGEIVIGTPQDEYSLKVRKTWDETADPSLLVPITVHLKVGDHELDSVVLDEENGWEAVFDGLPNPGTLHGEYTVVERPVPSGFIPVYADAVIDHAAKEITIEVSNRCDSDVPVDPGEPEELEASESEPFRSSEPEAPAEQRLVKVGDETGRVAVPSIALLAVCAAAAALHATRRRRSFEMLTRGLASSSCPRAGSRRRPAP